MLLARFIIGLTALIWMGYGGWLFVDPKGLSYMGMEFNHWSVTVEVQAMYGLAEFALGVFAALGILQPKRYLHANLVLWCLIYTALWVGRLVGIWQWGGGDYSIVFGAAGLPQSYNAGTLLLYELPASVLCAIALWQLRRHPDL